MIVALLSVLGGIVLGIAIYMRGWRNGYRRGMNAAKVIGIMQEQNALLQSLPWKEIGGDHIYASSPHDGRL